MIFFINPARGRSQPLLISHKIHLSNPRWSLEESFLKVLTPFTAKAIKTGCDQQWLR
jgi:hypothetical protein